MENMIRRGEELEADQDKRLIGLDGDVRVLEGGMLEGWGQPFPHPSRFAPLNRGILGDR